MFPGSVGGERCRGNWSNEDHRRLSERGWLDKVTEEMMSDLSLGSE
jgi:hypothetical protein